MLYYITLLETLCICEKSYIYFHINKEYFLKNVLLLLLLK